MSYYVKLIYEYRKHHCSMVADDGIHGMMNTQSPYNWTLADGTYIDRNDSDNDGRWFEVTNLSLASPGNFYKVTKKDIMREIQPFPGIKIGPAVSDTIYNPGLFTIRRGSNMRTILNSSFSLNKNNKKLIEAISSTWGLSRDEMISEMEHRGYFYKWYKWSDKQIAKMLDNVLAKEAARASNNNFKDIPETKQDYYLSDAEKDYDYVYVSNYNDNSGDIHNIYLNIKTDDFIIDGFNIKFPTEEEAIEFIREL